MTVNERVKVLRKSLNLSGEKFGAALGVKKNAISQIENGINNLSPQMFKAICREFDVREEWLRDGVEPMFNELSRSEELAIFFADVLKDEDDSFRKRTGGRHCQPARAGAGAKNCGYRGVRIAAGRFRRDDTERRVCRREHPHAVPPDQRAV